MQLKVVGFALVFACGFAAAVGILFCGSTARADVVVDWTFNSTLNDSSGNGNNGTLAGASYVTLTGTNGITLTGVNLASTQEVIDNSATNLPTLGGDPWTMNLWLNLSSGMGNLATVGGFGGPDAGAGGLRRMTQYFGGMYFWGDTADVATGAPYYTDSSWHMYTIMYSGSAAGGANGTVSMYRDGTLLSSYWNGDNAFKNVAEIVQVGSGFAGSVADFSLWNNCLSQGEVTFLTNPSALSTLAVWTGASNGDWSTSAVNWKTAGGAATNYSDGAGVWFDDGALSSNQTISVTAANVAPASVLFNNSTYSFSLTGNYGISGTASVTKTGSGTVTLSNSNSYTGGTTISGGTLVIGAAAALPTNAAYTVNSAGGLAFGPGVTAVSLGTLSGSGSFNLATTDSSAVTLTIGGGDGTASYTGVLGGSGSLVKIGGGLQSLSSISYSGNTTVSAGTLQLVDTVPAYTRTPPASTTVSIAASAALTVYSDYTSGFDGVKGDIGATLTGAGTLNKTGPGLTGIGISQGVGATMALTGQVNVLQGELGTDNYAGTWSSNTAGLYLAANTGFDLRGWSVQWGALTGSGSVVNSLTNGTDVLTVGAGGGSGTFSGTIADNSSIGGGILRNGSGVVNLTKTGTGTQVFSGANTYSGATIVNAGTLSLSGTATLGSGPVTITLGYLQLQPGATGAITGNSALTIGPGSSGALDLGGNSVALTATAISFAGGLVENGSLTYAGTYNGSGGLSPPTWAAPPP